MTRRDAVVRGIAGAFAAIIGRKLPAQPTTHTVRVRERDLTRPSHRYACITYTQGPGWYTATMPVIEYNAGSPVSVTIDGSQLRWTEP